MEIKNVTFPTALEEIDDLANDNIDVFVELEDGYTYVLVVTTPQNIVQLMERENKDYLAAGPPMIIVKELTYDCINSSLKSFCEGDAYWLKEYYLSGNFQSEILDEMIKRLQ